MVRGDMSLEGVTDLHVIAYSTLTAVREQDAILRGLSELLPVQRALGSSWGRTHVVRVCMQFLDYEGIDALRCQCI